MLFRSNDDTLRFINRGHDYACAETAIRNTAQRGIHTGAHLILGLPGESRELVLSHADTISQLPLSAIKLHQLQLIKGTQMLRQYEANPDIFKLYTVDEYVDLLVDFIERMNPSIAIERFVSQSPASLLLAPDWKLKNFEFVDKVKKELQARNNYEIGRASCRERV